MIDEKALEAAKRYIETRKHLGRSLTDHITDAVHLYESIRTKSADQPVGSTHDIMQAWGRIRHAMEYYASVSLYALRSSGEAGGIAKNDDVGYLAANCTGDVKTVDNFMRSPKRESVEVDELVEAIRTADNGLDGDPLCVLLDECPSIDMATTTRNAADEMILRVCRSVAEDLLMQFYIRRRE